MNTRTLLTDLVIALVVGLLLSAIAFCDEPRQQDTPLTALRISLAGLEMTDLALTQVALSRGYVEANPIMPTGPVAMTAVKVGVALGIDYVIRRVAKRNKRRAYILTGVLIGLNGFVVIHNARVIGEGGSR